VTIPRRGDEELISADASGQNLQVLKLANSVDDITWAGLRPVAPVQVNPPLLGQ
jgi:hypothetical protein